MYDRRSGMHVLFDEVNVSVDEAAKRGPRQLSVGITSRCNMNCHYCYCLHGEHDISSGMFRMICELAEELEVLDVTIGGGEPTLHPNFAELMSDAWTGFPFGLSVTTNGTNLGELLSLEGMLSSVRVSIDCFHRRVNSELIEKLSTLLKAHNVGVNLLWSRGTYDSQVATIKALLEIGIDDFLLLPERENGEFKQNSQDWIEMSQLFNEFEHVAQLSITQDALPFIGKMSLKTCRDGEYLFVHVDSKGAVRERSWSASCTTSKEKSVLKRALLDLNQIRRLQNENLERTCG